jgi:hypothetical protein
MGNSESFDLTESSRDKKEANSIYNFDLNGIFRRIGDIDSLNNSLKQENNSSLIDENEIDLTDTKSLNEDYNERLIDGLDEVPNIDTNEQQDENPSEEETVSVAYIESDQEKPTELSINENLEKEEA